MQIGMDCTSFLCLMEPSFPIKNKMGYPQYSTLKFAMQEEGKTVKKEKEKTFEKGVDKSGEVCYNSKAV